MSLHGIWHSTIPMCVFYLTGNLTYNYKKQGWDDLNFYGKQSNTQPGSDQRKRYSTILQSLPKIHDL